MSGMREAKEKGSQLWLERSITRDDCGGAALYLECDGGHRRLHMLQNVIDLNIHA